MDPRKCTSSVRVPPLILAPLKFSNKVPEKARLEMVERIGRHTTNTDVDVDHKEVYFLLLHFLSTGPCKKTFAHFSDELLEHQLLPRRYHSWYSRSSVYDKDDGDDGLSFPLTYAELAERYSHIEKDHLVKLLKQLMKTTCFPVDGKNDRIAPNAADVPTLLGTGSFSLLDCNKNMGKSQGQKPPAYLHWPHMQAGQVRALSLREIGGGFTKHHRSPSTRSACYAIAKPSTLLQKMQNIKKLRGHRNAVYCAIFDRSGRYVITGSDDRLVKIWSMETALCLVTCRGHEGDITDLAVSSNNAVVASAANDFVIRVWRLPDGMPVSVLQGHTGTVTAIVFSPRPNNVYQLLSSSDDGTCRIWEARFSHMKPRIYKPKPPEALTGKSTVLSNGGSSSINGSQGHHILCCTYNSDGTVFVTGSSDTFARVWSALKSNTSDPEQPTHEMDILSGHEDDVNYVQFSGCPVASRSSPSDSLKEDSVPKFRNSWFCHDNIVTCSRDGSAIIWVPRSRRSHGKAGRWIRAYHLKVPPPPLPPQPARGGPRQRFLPTPRGVNMIVWSLDNRFVLAAIMDCRICVWNAVDGSLVHSLTGHNASSYVLDVHPFNPRIAMSAGYDGRTIVWDIWKGTPVRIYEMGDFKLVDGKFSADGTSIVLSDDVGQIYLINTGQGELQKDAKYDQFFLGDYRPVVRDTSGSVLDQETQLLPYQRNIQDPLCDSSMMPYPEPYQTAFQKRRLGALGIEWRPSTMNFAIGPEINLGVGLDYHMPPLPDLERIIEPLPDFVIDAMFLEPENEILSEDSDSEYNVTEENSSEGEKASISPSSSDDSECSTENGDHNDGLRRSRRKKHKLDVMTSSGRKIKKRNLDDSAGTLSGNHKSKKPKKSGKITKRKSTKATVLRPKRLAARNARNVLSQISGTSSEEEEFGSEPDSSDSETDLLRDVEADSSDSEIVKRKSSTVQSEKLGFSENASQSELEETENPSRLSEPQQNKEGKRKLVLKFSLRDIKKEVPQEKRILKFSVAQPSAVAKDTDVDVYKEHNSNECADILQPEDSAREKEHETSWGEVKLRTSRVSKSGEEEQNCTTPLANDVGGKEKDPLDHAIESSRKEAFSLEKNKQKIGDSEALCHEDLGMALDNCADAAREPDAPACSNPSDDREIAPHKLTKIRFKTKTKAPDDPSSNEKLKFVAAADDPPETEDESFNEEAGPSVSYSERRNRCVPMKAVSQETDVAYRGFKLKVNHQESSRNEHDQLDRRSRSSRHHRANHGRSSSQRMLSPPVRKLSWLMLSEYEEGYRYIPQLGDEVVYMRQGHQEYSEMSGSREYPPRSLKGNIKAVEICHVEALDYTWGAGSGESCCKIKLKITDPSSNVFGKLFSLTLPELKDFSDFIVEKTLYDASIKRNWSTRDKCQVYWRNHTGENGDWWNGRVVLSQPKSPEFPESPWLRYHVRYKDDSSPPEQHNPWELYDDHILWERPHIDSESRDKLLHYFRKLEDKDSHTIQQLNQAIQKSDFCNRFAAPLYPELIKARLKNNYYRSSEAVKNDIRVMLSNAQSYFLRKDLAARVSNISDWLTKKLSRM